MNFFALFWSKFLPISYYMELYIQQANYGGSVGFGLGIMGEMLWFLLFLALGVLIYHLRLFSSSPLAKNLPKALRKRSAV